MKKISTYDVYIGNLFIVKNGIGEVSHKKYAVVRTKKHILAKPRYITIPEKKEVYVGCYSISIKDEGIPFLINATRLNKITGYKKVTTDKIKDIVNAQNIRHNFEKYMEKHM